MCYMCTISSLPKTLERDLYRANRAATTFVPLSFLTNINTITFIFYITVTNKCPGVHRNHIESKINYHEKYSLAKV